jgi:hypothetical protein
MPAFIIAANIQDGVRNDYSVLSEAMKKENFTPANMAGAEEKEFVYYGNLDLLQVTGIVKRVVASTGKQFSFTVIKNKLAEKQSHKPLYAKI